MPDVKLSINVSGSLRTANGTEVLVENKTVTLTQPGPQGGRRPDRTIEIPVDQWDAVNEAVQNVRRAISIGAEIEAKVKAQ